MFILLSTASHVKKTKKEKRIYFLILFWMQVREFLLWLVITEEPSPWRTRHWLVQNTARINYTTSDFSVAEDKFKVVGTADFSSYHFLWFSHHLGRVTAINNSQAEKVEEEKCLKEMTDNDLNFSLYRTNTLNPCCSERPIQSQYSDKSGIEREP